MASDTVLREQLVKLLNSSEAHAEFDDAVNNLPKDLRGKRPAGAEHSPWELLEHMRIAQWDILEYAINRTTNRRSSPRGTGLRRRRRQARKIGMRACAVFTRI